MKLENFKATLTKKLGPLPIWSWGVIAGAVILIVYYWYVNNKKVDKAGGTVVQSEDLVEAIAGKGGAGGGTQSQGDLPEDTVIETNVSWRQKAVNALLSQGVPPLNAQRALDKYLLGEPLTQAEASWVNTAIALWGLPPDGTFGIPTFDSPDPDTNPDPDPAGDPDPVTPPPVSAPPPANGPGGGYVAPSPSAPILPPAPPKDTKVQSPKPPTIPKAKPAATAPSVPSGKDVGGKTKPIPSGKDK